jgi:8-oxo-dGTP pyrophosphatase MutT (NUDIX family)
MVHEESAGGVVFMKDQVVILQRRSNNNWILPKGHLENDETHEEAAIREVFEETHLKAEPICEVGETSYQFRVGTDKIIDKHVQYFLMLAKTKKVKTEVYFSFYLVVSPSKALKLLTFPQDRDVLKNAWKKWIELKESGKIPEDTA